METSTNVCTKAWYRFNQFHEKNPHIYQAFVKYADASISKGHSNLSAEFIINVLRWETNLKSTDTTFKMPNWVKPFYARKYMREHPHHRSFFRTARSIADEV